LKERKKESLLKRFFSYMIQVTKRKKERKKEVNLHNSGQGDRTSVWIEVFSNATD
jgi:hypothetical protein